MSPSPAWAEDFPDPFVLNVSGEYWAFGTNSGDRNVQVLHSRDISTWAPAGDALPELPSWARKGWTWAPVVLDLTTTRGGAGTPPPAEGRFVLYVTVREPRSGRQAIMVASSPSPAGPYRPVGEGPLVFQLDLGGSIDASPFVDADGTAYLLWKSDANALKRPSSLWIQTLSADGLGLRGEPTELLSFDQSWETPLVEAPAMVREDGRYYLFYSGGWWENETYAIGYAVAEHPLGPWQKVTLDRPWLATTTEVSGPGGQEFFVANDGRRWMAYHGWDPRAVGYPAGGRRMLWLTPVSFPGGQPRAGT